MIFDQHGLLVTMNEKGQLDGGDTCANESTIRYCHEKLRWVHTQMIGYGKFIELIEKSPGSFVRHPGPCPDGAEFWADEKEFSRDQFISLIMLIGEKNDRELFFRVFKKFASRGFFYQNKDLPGLWMDTTLLFGRQIIKFWPIMGPVLFVFLVIADLYLLINSLVKCFFKIRWEHDLEKFLFNDLRDVDDRNHIVMLIDAATTMPTPTSILATKIYLKFRPKHEGSKTGNNAIDAVNHYFRKESGNNPEIGFALISCMNRFFKNYS